MSELNALVCPRCGSRDLELETPEAWRCQACDTVLVSGAMRRKESQLPGILAALMVAAAGGALAVTLLEPEPEPAPGLQEPAVLRALPPPKPTAVPDAVLRAELVEVHPGKTSVGGAFWLTRYRNVGDAAVARPSAIVSLFDSDGHRVAEQRGWAEVEVLEPGASTPVLVLLADPPAFSKAVVTAHSPEPVTSAPLEAILDVGPLVTREGRAGRSVATGSVHNRSGDTVRWIKVVLTGHNAKGELVAFATGAPSESRLMPEGLSGFEIDCCTFQTGIPTTFSVFAKGSRE